MPTLLFLDFGTAYSKAATCKSGEPPVALAIGNAVQQRVGDPHMIRTALFISRSGEVCFGEAAIDTAAAEERQPYDAVKDVLTNAEHRSELDEMVPDNPAGQPLSKRQAITLFLAFFVRAALRAHEVPEEVRLSVAMPVFAKDKQRWVSDELTACLADAYVLAEHFRNTMFRSINLREAVRVLNQAGRPQVVADPPTIVEPIAAVAGHLLHFTPDGSGAPGLMMIVDVGAGTTDIAMFAKGQVEGVVTLRHVKGSKTSLPWAGKAIDRALIDHLVRKGGGGDRLRADLQREGNGQPIKEDIFRERSVTRSGTSSTLDDFLQSEAMSRVVMEIQSGFDGVLQDVDESFFKHRTVAVRFSGGGHDLPFLAALVRPEQYLAGKLIRMGKAQTQPRWRNERRFSSLYNEIGRKFHRMTVALGGAYYCADGQNWLRLEDDVSSH